jgi:hypothetical protein
VLADGTAHMVYVALQADNQETGSVVRSSTYGETWEVIGGACGKTAIEEDSCVEVNGLSPETRALKLAIDYSSATDSRRLLAATSSGLWVFNKEGKATWSQIMDTTCGLSDQKVMDVLTISTQPNGAFIAVQDGNNDGLSTKVYADRHGYDDDLDEGIYWIKWNDTFTTISCQRLQGEGAGEVPVYNPTNLAISVSEQGTFLYAGGSFSQWPTVHRTPVDFAAEDLNAQWSLVFDLYYKEEDGIRKSRNKDWVNDASDTWWDSYLPLHPDYIPYFKLDAIEKLTIGDIWVSPADPTKVLVSLMGDKYEHKAVSQHLYVSDDQGASFEVFEAFEGENYKSGKHMTSNISGSKLLFSTGCQSFFIYRLDDLGLGAGTL